MLLPALFGCDRDAAESSAAPVEQAGPIAKAVTPSDTSCLKAEELRAEPVGTEAIRERYRHWTLCDYNPDTAEPYLDLLVRRNDPVALHTRSVLLTKTDPEESERLRRRAEELGYRPWTREQEMREIAGLK
ncbi:hypothetical protein [Brevundimonas sp.]|uniref:hypothetical protein n=1 Tax=Brevundimonas sp. TaxID=1871086 RepID=UPI002EDB1912